MQQGIAKEKAQLAVQLNQELVQCKAESDRKKVAIEKAIETLKQPPKSVQNQMAGIQARYAAKAPHEASICESAANFGLKDGADPSETSVSRAFSPAQQPARSALKSE